MCARGGEVGGWGGGKGGERERARERERCEWGLFLVSGGIPCKFCKRLLGMCH